MSLDKRVSTFIASYRGRRACIDKFGIFCARKMVMYLAAVVFVWVALWGELSSGDPWLLFLMAFIVTATAWLVTYIMEYIFNRRRPFRTLHKKTLGTYWVPTPSFPSAHATIAFALATSAVMIVPSWGWILYFPAILVAFGRVYVGVHYMSDVTAGAVVGSIVSWGLLSILGI